MLTAAKDFHKRHVPHDQVELLSCVSTVYTRCPSSRPPESRGFSGCTVTDRRLSLGPLKVRLQRICTTFSTLTCRNQNPPNSYRLQSNILPRRIVCLRVCGVRQIGPHLTTPCYALRSITSRLVKKQVLPRHHSIWSLILALSPMTNLQVIRIVCGLV